MILKCGPAGNLFPYLEDQKDARGRDREQPPVPLRGEVKRAMRLLVAQAPAVAVPELQGPLWVQHCRQQLTHLINGFSEEQKIVEANLPAVIQGTEALLLAGLPRDALHFVWYEHPQRRGTHTHCGVVRSLLPRGGYYTPQLSLELAQLFSRLVSRRLGLSDPLDPAGARPIRSPYGVAKAATAPVVATVTAEVRTWLEEGRLKSHALLLALLEELRLEILFHPDETGAPQARPAGKAAGKPGRGYPNTVTVRTAVGDLIYFTGPVCHPNFSHLDWEIALGQRKLDVANLQAHPQLYYAYFVEELGRRIKAQQQAYPLDEGGRGRITLRDFDWLNPASPLWRSPLAELYGDPPPTPASLLELAGPTLGFPRLPVPDRGYEEAAADPAIREFGHAFYDDFDPALKDITAPDEFEEEAEALTVAAGPEPRPPVPTPARRSLNPPTGETSIVAGKPQPSGASAAAAGERSAGVNNPLPPLPADPATKPALEISEPAPLADSPAAADQMAAPEAPAEPAKNSETPAPAAGGGESPPPDAGAAPDPEAVRDDNGEGAGAAPLLGAEEDQPGGPAADPAVNLAPQEDGQSRTRIPESDLAEARPQSAAELANPDAPAASETIAAPPAAEPRAPAEVEVLRVPESGGAGEPPILPVIAAGEKSETPAPDAPENVRDETRVAAEIGHAPAEVPAAAQTEAPGFGWGQPPSLALQICLQVAQWHERLRDRPPEILRSAETAAAGPIPPEPEPIPKAPNKPKTGGGPKFAPAAIEAFAEQLKREAEQIAAEAQARLQAKKPGEASETGSSPPPEDEPPEGPPPEDPPPKPPDIGFS